MTLEEVLQKVDPRWHEQFLRFVDSGEASDDFRQFLDVDEPCQQAVEAAFQVQAAGVAKAVRALQRSPDIPAHVEAMASTTPARQLVEVLHSLIDTPAPERTPVVREAFSAMAVELDSAEQQALKAVLSEMSREVAGVSR